jgi:hypothetical protein
MKKMVYKPPDFSDQEDVDAWIEALLTYGEEAAGGDR